MLKALGGNASADADTLTVSGTGLRGGTVDSRNGFHIHGKPGGNAVENHADARTVGLAENG